MRSEGFAMSYTFNQQAPRKQYNSGRSLDSLDCESSQQANTSYDGKTSKLNNIAEDNEKALQDHLMLENKLADKVGEDISTKPDTKENLPAGHTNIKISNKRTKTTDNEDEKSSLRLSHYALMLDYASTTTSQPSISSSHFDGLYFGVNTFSEIKPNNACSYNSNNVNNMFFEKKPKNVFSYNSNNVNIKPREKRIKFDCVKVRSYNPNKNEVLSSYPVNPSSVTEGTKQDNTIESLISVDAFENARCCYSTSREKISGVTKNILQHTKRHNKPTKKVLSSQERRRQSKMIRELIEKASSEISKDKKTSHGEQHQLTTMKSSRKEVKECVEWQQTDLK